MKNIFQEILSKFSEYLRFLHTMEMVIINRVARTKNSGCENTILHWFQSNKAHDEPSSVEKVNMKAFREEKRKEVKRREEKRKKEKRREEKRKEGDGRKEKENREKKNREGNKKIEKDEERR